MASPGPPRADAAVKPKPMPVANGFVDFTAGALAGGVVCLVTQPFDTVKVMLQSQPKRFANAMQAFRAICKQSVS